MPKHQTTREPPEFNHIEPVEGDLLSDEPDALLRTHRKLQLAILRLRKNVDKGNALIDFRNCEEIDPGGLLLTMYAVFPLLRDNQLSLWYRSRGAVRAYLLENIDHYRQRRSAHSNNRSDDFLLRRIKTREAMVNDLNQYASSLRQASLISSREVAIWETQVGELTTNGFQHGNALRDDPQERDLVMNLVAGKAYEEKGRVEMGVLDFGAGIPRVIERVAPDTVRAKGDGQLIAYALRKGITSRTVIENQGAGLHGIVDAVKENGGRLLLFSGGGLVCVKNGRVSSRKINDRCNQPTLEGTLAIIILNLQGGVAQCHKQY